MKEKLSTTLSILALLCALLYFIGCEPDERRTAYWLKPIHQTNQVGEAEVQGTNLIQMFFTGRIERLGYHVRTGDVTVVNIPVITGTNYVRFPAPPTTTNVITITNYTGHLRVDPELP